MKRITALALCALMLLAFVAGCSKKDDSSVPKDDGTDITTPVAPDPKPEAPVTPVAPDPKPEAPVTPVAPDPKPVAPVAPVAPDPKPEPKPEPKPDPKPVAPTPKPDPKPVAPTPKPDPKPVAPKPDPKPVAPTPKPDPKPEKPAATEPTAQAIYDSVLAKIEMGRLSVMDKETFDVFYNIDSAIMDSFYGGYSQMTMPYEVMIVKAKTAKDVDAVKAAVQKRLDAMLQAAFGYTLPIPENAKIYTSGKYVMLAAIDPNDEEAYPLAENAFMRSFDASVKELFKKLDRAEGKITAIDGTNFTMSGTVDGKEVSFSVTVPDGTYIEKHGVADRVMKVGDSVSIVFETKIDRAGPYTVTATFVDLLEKTN